MRGGILRPSGSCNVFFKSRPLPVLGRLQHVVLSRDASGFLLGRHRACRPHYEDPPPGERQRPPRWSGWNREAVAHKVLGQWPLAKE